MEDELTRFWKSDLNNGTCIGAYGALVSNPAVPQSLFDRVYGDVHMLSHLQGVANWTKLRRVRELEARRQSLEAELADARTRLAERDATIHRLNADLAEARWQCADTCTAAESHQWVLVYEQNPGSFSLAGC